jgi:hypothetical protein
LQGSQHSDGEKCFEKKFHKKSFKVVDLNFSLIRVFGQTTG